MTLIWFRSIDIRDRSQYICSLPLPKIIGQSDKTSDKSGADCPPLTIQTKPVSGNWQNNVNCQFLRTNVDRSQHADCIADSLPANDSRLRAICQVQ